MMFLPRAWMGTRAVNCLIPTLTAQDEVHGPGLLLRGSEAPTLRPLRVGRLRGRHRPRRGLAALHGGFNYYVVEQNLKITGAYERIVPNVVGAANWKQKDTNHLVLQLQLFYF